MKTTPFWHEAAPPEAPSGTVPPAEVDVAIVGAGFTGLSAALGLAEAGRSVAVFEAGPPGAGASTRNGGMIGWGHRTSLASLAKRYGAEAARAMLAEALASLEFTTALVQRVAPDAGHRQTGRFLGASSKVHYDRLARWAAHEAPRLGMDVDVVPEAEQGRHIASEAYRGGLYFPRHGGLHPALFHRGLLQAARAAGAVILDHTPVTAVDGAPGGWRIGHGNGTTAAREVVYAGNGYTGGSKGPFRGMAQRLIPVPSTIIATEVLGANRVASLFPGGSMIVETRAFHSYFRPDPGGERVLYGGRASLLALPEAESARRLRRVMLSVFPDLAGNGTAEGEAGVRITHSWNGYVAFTADGVPHIGQVEGVWHACGYNGSGVAMAPYLGWRLAQRVLGQAEGATGLDGAMFGRQPFYRGDPWFLRALELWFRARDWREGVPRLRP